MFFFFVRFICSCIGSGPAPGPGFVSFVDVMNLVCFVSLNLISFHLLNNFLWLLINSAKGIQ